MKNEDRWQMAIILLYNYVFHPKAIVCHHADTSGWTPSWGQWHDDRNSEGSVDCKFI